MNEAQYFEQFVGDEYIPDYWAIIYGTKYIQARCSTLPYAEQIQEQLQDRYPSVRFSIRPSYPNGDSIGFISRIIGVWYFEIPAFSPECPECQGTGFTQYTTNGFKLETMCGRCWGLVGR